MSSVTVDMGRTGVSLDLERRMAALAESSSIRGVFFNQFEDYLRTAHGLDDAGLRGLVGPARRSYGMYPARDFARLCAITGALADPDPVEGLRRVSRDMVPYFAATWHGRVFQRLLRPDPYTTMQFVARAREYVASYGTMRVETRGPGHAIVHIFDEPCWIEAVQRGGCEGMLRACGVEGEVTPEMDGLTRGRLHVRWSLA